MADFPVGRVAFKAEIAFGVVPDIPFVNPNDWSDVTPYFLDQTVTITRGRTNETEETQISSLNFELDNNTGLFTPDNPESILYPEVKRGVLCRYGIKGGQSFLQLPDINTGANYISTPDAAALDIVGDIDIAFEIQPYGVLSANQVFGKWRNTGNQRSWAIVLAEDPDHPSTFRVVFQWSPNGTLASSLSIGTTNTFSYSEKLAIRFTLDVNDGAGNSIARWYSANSWGDPWVLFAANTFGGISSIFSSSAPLDIGSPDFDYFPFIGKLFRLQVKNGIDGTLVANPDFTTQAVGATGFTDSTGRVWTVVGSAAIDNTHTRFFGHIDSYEVSWPYGNTTGTIAPESRVVIQASSLRRRMAQGEQPLESPLRREFISGLNTLVVGYWPLEDGVDTRKAASGLANYSAASVSGFDFESNDGLVGSDSLPTLQSLASFSGAVPVYTDSALFHTTGFVTYIPTTAPAIEQTLMRVFMVGSTLSQIQLSIDATNVICTAYNSVGDILSAGTFAHSNAFVDEWGYWLISIYQSGADVKADIFFNVAGTASYPIGFSVTFAGQTMGRVSQLTSEFGSQLGGATIGHISVLVSNGGDAYIEAIDGRSGEVDIQRFRRLCDEQGIFFGSGETPSVGIALGSQTIETLTALLEETWLAGNAIYLDGRFFNGLQYIPLWDLQNQPTQFALDAALEHITNPISPTLDDQFIRNRIQSTRTFGSFVIRQDDESIDEEGLYADEITINLETDDQLEGDANWRLAIGTYGGMSYPPVTVDLAKASGLIPTWLNENTDVGCVVSLANLPRQADSTLRRLLLQGYTETITPVSWILSLNCTPYPPYEIAVLNSGGWAELRLDAENSTVNANITSTATTMVVKLNSGTAWTHDDGNFLVMVGGEQMNVTAIAGVVADTQSFTVVRSVNSVTKAHLAGEKVSLAFPVRLALVGG